MAHLNATGVAGEPAGSFRGNSRAVLELGLTRLLELGQRRRLDVQRLAAERTGDRCPGLVPRVGLFLNS